jgi:hypothetical protein
MDKMKNQVLLLFFMPAIHLPCCLRYTAPFDKLPEHYDLCHDITFILSHRERGIF